MQETMGTCNHGTFNLREGCPQCIAERMAEAEAEAEVNSPENIRKRVEAVHVKEDIVTNIVKVQFFNSEEELSTKPYTYLAEDPLQVGDIVMAPVRGITAKARVNQANVPESEIAKFKDSVKTIPTDSLIPQGGLAEAASKAGVNVKVVNLQEEPELDRLVNLCDTCGSRNDYPICFDPQGEFGEGLGNDNIIKCDNYVSGPAKPCTIPLNVKIDPKRGEAVTYRKPDGIVAEAETVQEALDDGASEIIIEAAAIPGPVTALITIEPDRDPKVVALYDEGLKLLAYAQDRKITCNEDQKPATEELAIIAKTRKAIEDIRKEYVNPIRHHLDTINTIFKEFTAPLVTANDLNRSKLQGYKVEVEKERLKAEETNRMAQEVARRQAEESGSGEFTVDTTPIVVPEVSRKVLTDLGSTSTQKIYKWELVDISQVPREYLTVNASLIQQQVKSSKGSISIPGIRVFTEDTIRVNTR